jgi:sulfite exporter TauE/SafE
MLTFLAALSLGFLGSFHCVGMCGPIALALPLDRSSAWKAAVGSVSYNMGRITTYASLGFLFGIVGKSFVISGGQRSLTITIGLLLLLTVLLPEQVLARIRLTNHIYPFILRQKAMIGKMFNRKGLSSLFFIGVLNGLLPCGFVYLGLATAIASGNAFTGAGFMAGFGAGTIPAMLTLSLARNSLPPSLRSRIRQATPIFIGIVSILFILRGLNLGIPYISPELTTISDTRHNCCHK